MTCFWKHDAFSRALGVGRCLNAMFEHVGGVGVVGQGVGQGRVPLIASSSHFPCNVCNVSSPKTFAVSRPFLCMRRAHERSSVMHGGNSCVLSGRPRNDKDRHGPRRRRCAWHLLLNQNQNQKLPSVVFMAIQLLSAVFMAIKPQLRRCLSGCHFTDARVVHDRAVSRPCSALEHC